MTVQCNGEFYLPILKEFDILLFFLSLEIMMSVIFIAIGIQGIRNSSILIKD